MYLSGPDRLTALLVRFVLSGGIATALHWALMAVLIHFHGSAVLATALGALAGACANYLLQQRFTFRVRVEHLQTMPRYALVTLLGWLANLALFAVFHAWMGLGVTLAQLITSGLVALLNFALYKRVVFHDRIHSRLAI